ncbi:MAG: amidohydrolase [Roseinatronobacter sp.]
MEFSGLTRDDMAALTDLRHALHARPEISGQEFATAARIAEFLRPTHPTQCVEGLGGSGLAFVYDSGRSGPRVMFRAELDALPIQEQTGLDYAPQQPGKAHLCGHDGHMAILAGLGLWLARNPPRTGQVVLLFQPAEETGEGARSVIADPRFETLRPDWAFALHNMPGVAQAALVVAPGVASCASIGLRMRFSGREAHAAQPETGISPAPALTALMAALGPFSEPGPMGPDFRLATLCHLSMGQPAFGIAPASAEAWVTLRGHDDKVLADLEAQVLAQLEKIAGGLEIEITRHDHFHATVNDPGAAKIVRIVQAKLGFASGHFAVPMRPSEDFGAFSGQTRTALIFLGAGTRHPALHDPAYDFPDSLIAPGVAVFAGITEQILGA